MDPIRKELRRAVDGIFRAEVVSRLKPLGFRMKNGRLERWRDRAIDFVSVQRNWVVIAADKDTEFTIECGVYVRGFLDLVDPPQARWPPAWILCHARQRLSHMLPGEGDPWWKLAHATLARDIDRVRADIARRVERDMIPWFERHGTLAGLAAAMDTAPKHDSTVFLCGSPPECRAHAGFLHVMDGNLAAARDCLARARAVMDKTRRPDHTPGLLQKLADCIAAAEATRG